MGPVGTCSRQQAFPMKLHYICWLSRLLTYCPWRVHPRLIVVGREVQLGSGRADLIAIEPSGRIAIIEIKLAWNAEARRAVSPGTRRTLPAFARPWIREPGTCS